jgi:hypothetical protein
MAESGRRTLGPSPIGSFRAVFDRISPGKPTI